MTLIKGIRQSSVGKCKGFIKNMILKVFHQYFLSVRLQEGINRFDMIKKTKTLISHHSGENICLHPGFLLFFFTHPVYGFILTPNI